jgi:hypothetical protein
MSDVNPQDRRKIEHIDDVIGLYSGAGKDSKTGFEIEIAFFDPASADLSPMSVAQNKVVRHAVNDKMGAELVRNEPTSDVLETGSDAFHLNALRRVMDDGNKNITAIADQTRAIGLKRSYFQELPDRTAAQLLSHIVDVPRYQAFFNPPRADMMGIAAYFAVSKSNQVSVSYSDPDHLLDNVRRLYFLAPFLYMIADNSSGFDQGKPFSGHAGMHHRAALADRGGVPPYVFTAKTGADYILAHIHHVMNNRLYVYYDEEGTLHRLPAGTWWSFDKELKERGLNTATNYFFAQSILWPDVKISPLRDKKGEIYNHRYEARMFGVGFHQHQSALLIVAGLAANPLFAQRTDQLLADFGFDMRDPDAARKNLDTSYKNAREHGGKFMDIAYGTGRMLDFGKAFAALLEDAYTGAGFDEELSPILQICRSGCTDAKINRLLFPTLQDALNHQRRYDDRLFDNPNQNARTAFAQDVSKISGNCCAQSII